jgi:phosphomannomutase
MTTTIKFGTDGWRAIIAKEYTVENVARVALGTALWLNQNVDKPSVVIGHDCRFGGKLFAETTAKILAHYAIKVYLAEDFVSTPMVSLGTLRKNASLGVVITASHNPPEYNGFKLKGNYGGPLLPEQVKEVEDLIPDDHNIDLDALNIEELKKEGKIEVIDLEGLYVEHVEANFDLDAIRNSTMGFAYDAMYGAGQNVMRRILPDITFLHADNNPGFEGVAPEPIHRNLEEFSATIKASEGEIHCGLATDGDADRIGLYDHNGNFVDSHHLILLLIKYLVEEKGFNGKVVTAFSVSPKVKKMCEHFGLEHQVVKIGFKYVAEVMLKDDVLLGGEESGGIAVKGHIPERDGIWMGLIIWEYMVKSGKSLNELIDEVYEIVGSFSFERIDLTLTEGKKLEIMRNCESGIYHQFGDLKVTGTETIDGFKYHFNDDQWVMIRPSGTEPVLRTYAESSSSEKAFDILHATHKTFGA